MAVPLGSAFREHRMRSCMVYVIALTVAYCAAAAEPTRMLPAPPGPILDLRANAAGDLYVRTATKVLWI